MTVTSGSRNADQEYRTGLISVCVPTRDRLAYLRESLAGILTQRGVEFEVIVADNLSTDGTREYLQQVTAYDPRVRVISPERTLGLYANHNLAFREARGEYICFCHDDDRYGPNLLAQFAKFLDAHPRVGIVSADYQRIDATGATFGVRRARSSTVVPGVIYIDRTLRTAISSIALPGCMIRRAALPTTPFDESGTLGFSDIALWFRIAEEWDIGHIADPLWSYRRHSGASSQRTSEIPRDFGVTFEAFCDGYLTRHPADHRRVRRWRNAIRRFRFWSVLYDVATRSATQQSDKSLNTRVGELAELASGPAEHAVAGAARTLLRLGLGRMLGALLRYARLTRALVLTR